jgi:hypothetical protein
VLLYRQKGFFPGNFGSNLLNEAFSSTKWSPIRHSAVIIFYTINSIAVEILLIGGADIIEI